MKNKFEKEKIGLLKTQMNQLWNAAFVTLGGAIAFLLGRDAYLHIALGVLGVFIALVFVYAYMIRRTKAAKLINYLKEGRKHV